MSSRITYGRLGKKRALLQGTVKNSTTATSSEEDPLDLLPPSTPSPARPTKQRKIAVDSSPSKLEQRSGKSPASKSSPSLASGSRLPAVQRTTRRLAKSPSADPLALPDISPRTKATLAKQKHTETSRIAIVEVQVGNVRSSKRTKVTRTIVQDDDDQPSNTEQLSKTNVSTKTTVSVAPSNQPRMTRKRSSLAPNAEQQKSVVDPDDSSNPKAPVSPTTPTPKLRRIATAPLGESPKEFSDVFETPNPSGSRMKSTSSRAPPENTSHDPASRKARMLRRSNTLPDTADFSSAVVAQSEREIRTSSQASSSSIRTSSSHIQQTKSLPAFPPPFSKPDNNNDNPASQSLDESTPLVVEAAPTQPRPNLRTYSSSRSFLAPLPTPASPSAQTSIGAISNSESQEQESLQYESYADLRRKYRVDLSSDDDMESGIAGPIDVKSIGELRDKGENRRFMDDMGYLLEGLDQEMTIAVKRLSAIKLVNNMADVDYVRRAKACDALGSAWDALDQANKPIPDKIISLALVAFAALATRDPRHADELVKQGSVAKLLAEQVSAPSEDDPLGFDQQSGSRVEDARRLAIGKSERLLISQIRSVLRKADVLENDDYLTSRRLSSQSILLSRIHDTSTLSNIVDSLLLETRSLAERANAFSLGLPILPAQPDHGTPDLQHISNCLKILESALGSSSGEFVKETFEEKRRELTANLVMTCGLCASLDHDAEQDRPDDASECLISTLRMLVKVVGDNPAWSIELASVPSTISLLLRITSTYHHPKRTPTPTSRHKDILLSQDTDADADADAHAYANRLDVMCLALAILTSLMLDAGSSTRSSVFRSKMATKCQFGRSCMKECQCAGIGAVGSIEVLVGMYVEESKKAKDSTSAESSFLTGHLAVLLGLLYDDADEKDILALLSFMPGPGSSASSSPVEKIDAWIEAIQEFIGLYADLTQRFANAIKQQSASKDDEDENDMMSDGQQEGDGSLREDDGGVGSVPGIFAPGETNGSQKGVELAEKVIGILREVADRLGS